jgi:hypothetical protein
LELHPEKGAFAPITSLANKLPEHAARLAGILAITEDAYAQEATDDQMARGISLAEFYAAEAFRLHGVAQIDPQLRQADALHKRLQEAFGRDEFQVRDVLALNISAIATADQARALLGILKDNGHVERVDREGPTGRSKEYWRLFGE